MTRLLAIAWKELLQLRRDRLTLAMMVMLPIVQIVLFGWAIDTDVRHIPTTVLDQDRTAASRELAASLMATGSCDPVGEVRDPAELSAALRSGRAKVGLVIPARYAERLALGRPAAVQLVVDGSDPQSVASATSAAGGLVAQRAMAMVLARAGAREAPLSLESTTWYNPDLRTAVNVVPGLVGVILTMTMVMLTAMAVARERERGTLEQLVVSPIRKWELVVGKILPFVMIGYVQMTLVLIAGYVVFDVPVVGSLPLLYALAFGFIAANLALGLFFSTLARTQQQAMQMSFFFLLPNILLSGFMFPREGMPRPAQWLSEALPLTHFLKIIRGIALRGAGFDDLQGSLLRLAVILAVLVTLTSLRFRKNLA